MENILDKENVRVGYNTGTRIRRAIGSKQLRIGSSHVWMWREDVEGVFTLKST